MHVMGIFFDREHISKESLFYKNVAYYFMLMHKKNQEDFLSSSLWDLENMEPIFNLES